MRLDNGITISMLVAPACTKLKRMPRTPAAFSFFNSSSDTLVLTTATPRAFGNAEFFQNRNQSTIVHTVRRWLYDHITCGAQPLLQQPVISNRGIGRQQGCRRVDREVRIVNVMVAVC